MARSVIRDQTPGGWLINEYTAWKGARSRGGTNSREAEATLQTRTGQTCRTLFVELHLVHDARQPVKCPTANCWSTNRRPLANRFFRCCFSLQKDSLHQGWAGRDRGKACIRKCLEKRSSLVAVYRFSEGIRENLIIFPIITSTSAKRRTMTSNAQIKQIGARSLMRWPGGENATGCKVMPANDSHLDRTSRIMESFIQAGHGPFLERFLRPAQTPQFVKSSWRFRQDEVFPCPICRNRHASNSSLQ